MHFRHIRRLSAARRLGAIGLTWLVLGTSGGSAAAFEAPAKSAAAQPASGAAPDLLAQLDDELAEIQEFIAAARFRTALSVAGASRELFDELEAGPESDSRRARLEVLAATAEVALGRKAAARASMIRALEADPSFTTSEGDTSPKVLRVLEEARRRTGIREPSR